MHNKVGRPGEAPKRPAGHNEQRGEPDKEKLPGEHRAHALELEEGANEPAVQLLHMDRPAVGTKRPLGHTVHEVLELDELTEPAEQLVHGVPAVEYLPGVHALHTDADAPELLPAAQLEQVDRPAEPAM